MKPRILFVAMLTLLAICLMPATPAQAQLARRDVGEFIEGLRKEGLRDLLRHMVDTEPMDDPVLRQQVLLNLLLLDYQDTAATGDIPTALGHFEQALQALRDLIREQMNHHQRPIWETQLAELLLFEYLDAIKTNAAYFYQFGVPTREQSESFEKAVVEAIELLESADVRFFQLQSELPKEDNHTADRVNTGLWARMIDEYYRTRTQFSLAHALLYGWHLPADHEYFTTPNPRIVRKQREPGAERARLLSQGVQAIEPLATDTRDEWNIRLRAQGIYGRLRLAQRRYGDAIEQFDVVLRAAEGNISHLLAGIGKAYALDLDGKTGEGLTLLEELRAHPQVTGALLMRVLVTDATHRVLLRNAQAAAAETRALAMTQAYQPYLDLLADPTLGELAQALRNYVHRRWADSIDPAQDLNEVPAVVVSAMGEMVRMEGQNLAISGDIEGAREKLTEALRINTALLAREDATVAVRAQAAFNQALATYFMNTADTATVTRAATMLTDMAEQYPDQKAAETAISYAVEILHRLQFGDGGGIGVREAYMKACRILLNKFPTLEAADNERFFFVNAILLPQREFQESADILSRIPPGHPTYFIAQRERLYALRELANEDASRVPDLTADAERVLRESQAAGGSAVGEAGQVIRNAGGHARLILARIHSDKEEVETALGYLEGFESEYLGDTELLRLGLGQRIILLARAGQFDMSSVQASQMMRSFPDDAAPVVDQVLTGLDEQATQLREQAAKELVARRRQELEERAQGMAATASRMAQLLVDWANNQGFSEEEMVPFRLVLARSLRTAGRSPDALTMLRPILRQYPDDADTIHEAAEAFYAIGGEANFIEAGELFKKLISGLAPDANGIYPDRYWNAWMRYFQICERINQNTNIIAARVRTLEASDPNLGGEPYRSELIRLRNRFE